MAAQLVVANCPSQASERVEAPRPALVLTAARPATPGSTVAACTRGRTTIGATQEPPERPEQSQHCRQPPAAACRHPAACRLQDLAKTNRVFVAPSDPTAALPYVQLGDL